MGNFLVNEILLVLLGAAAAFFVNFGLKHGSTRNVVRLSIIFSLTLFVIDRIVWLKTERNLVDHATCLLAPGARPCSEPGKAPGGVRVPDDGAAVRGSTGSLPPGGREVLTRDEAPRATPGASAAVQLGAFATVDEANEAWRRLRETYFFMPRGAGVITSVWNPAAGGDKPLFRLRSQAMPPGDAEEICETLRMAGESCAVIL